MSDNNNYIILFMLRSIHFHICNKGKTISVIALIFIYDTYVQHTVINIWSNIIITVGE